MKRINCFIPHGDKESMHLIVEELNAQKQINAIYLITNSQASDLPASYNVIHSDKLWSSETIQKIADQSTTDYSLIITKEKPFRPGLYALERMLSIADDTSAGLVYADHYIQKEDQVNPHPVIDYQKGSLRDDFDFGSLLLYRSEDLKKAASSMKNRYSFAGLYDLRLKVSQHAPLVHINEYLYTEVETDHRKSGEKQFDYVDPKNREVQIEMEKACTDHLKNIGAYLNPSFKEIRLDEGEFTYEASVIIPVRNRIRTIGDAIQSVLTQKTSFPFNLIIIDNHSTDGTTEEIKRYASDQRIIHIQPERTDLGIGGCWNTGVHHPDCGRFAVQLDSDDVYSDEHTLQKIVDAFYMQKTPMVIGTYMMTNFQMETIPPGIIDHKEWTPDNGRNNALRINGLGAPRAFFTPLLRKIKLPNTSYGEDYAVGLRISREYRIGRIYEVLYHCRRWEGNSDAALDIQTLNRYNYYKDKIRTWEIEARVKQQS